MVVAMIKMAVPNVKMVRMTVRETVHAPLKLAVGYCRCAVGYCKWPKINC